MADIVGSRIGTPLVRLIAVGAGDGGAVANAVVLFINPGRKVILRKITWRNLTGGNGNLLIGYGDRTGAGSLFRQVHPNLFMVALDDRLEEGQIPLMGNSREGFVPDGTVPTGTTGDILVETDAAGVGAGTPVEVQAEVELI